MTQSYILAETGSATFALSADKVAVVASVGEITPVPLASPHVAGIAAIRSQVITVIDVGLTLGEATSVAQVEPSLIVVEIDGHSYGLAVDDIHDVIEIEDEPRRLGAPFSAQWRRIALGVLDIDGKAVIAVDPAAIIQS